MNVRRPASSCSLLVLALATLAPRPASACDEVEQYEVTNKWLGINAFSERIASDGVVLFRASRGSKLDTNRDDAEALAALSAEVTVDGQPVTGSFELEDGWSGLVWRPDAPLPPGTILTISVAANNDAIDDEYVGDLPADIENLYAGPFEIEVSDQSAPGLEVLVASAGHDGVVLAQLPSSEETLETLVCCDGAYPTRNDVCGVELFWYPGHCARTVGLGYLFVTWAVDLESVPAELAGNLTWRVELDDGVVPIAPGLPDWSKVFREPTCGRIVAHQRATGETLVIHEECFGEDVADSLGIQMVDPTAELDQMCEGEPYVCDVIGESRWDETSCEPWPAEEPSGDGDSDGDGDSGDEDDSGDGGGCSVAPGPGHPGRAGLAMLGLLALLGGLWTRRAIE